MRVDDRAWRWLIWIALVLFAAVAFYARQRGIHWGGDDADYVLLARGLGELRYHDTFLVGAPPHTTYPPVYPLLLALWGSLFGDSLSTLSAMNVLFMMATLGILAHLVSVHVSNRAAAIVVLVITANPLVLQHASRLLSEAPMMFFGVSAIWFADRRPGRTGTMLCIVCSTLCAMTRLAGVAVVAGIGLHWLIRRRWGAAAGLSVVAGTAVGGWLLWTMQETADPSLTYMSRFIAYDIEGTPVLVTFFSALSSKAVTVLGSQLPDVLALPLTGATRWDNLAWAPLSLGAVGVGLWTVGRRVPTAGLTILAYAGVLAVWPFTDGRLLVPLIPVLVLGALAGAVTLGRLLRRPDVGRALAVGIAVLLFLGGIWRAAPAVGCDGSVFSETPACVRESELGLGRAIAHLGENAPDDAIVMARRGEITHYYTGLVTLGWPRARDALAVAADTILARTGVDYILASHAYVGRLVGLSILLEKACSRLSIEYRESPHTLLLAVRPEGSPPATDACEAVRSDFPAPATE